MKELDYKTRYEELLREKSETDIKIAKLKAGIDQAKQNGAKRARYIDPRVFKDWQIKLAYLQQKSQSIQREIGTIKTEMRAGCGKTLGELFIDVSRLRLPTDVFDMLLREALNLRDGEIH
jgi:hypothetical protein